MSLGDLEARVERVVRRVAKKLAPKSETTKAVAMSIADEVAETALASYQQGRATSMTELCLENLKTRMTSLEQDVLVVSLAAEPTYVMCLYSSSLHRALPSGKTACGWPWKKKNHRIATRLEWEEAHRPGSDRDVCDRCRES